MALIRAVCARLKVPKKYAELALLVGRWHLQVHRAMELRPATLLELLERCDGLRRPERFAQILTACEMDKRGRKGLQQRDYPQRDYLLAALDAVNSVDYASIDKDLRSAKVNAEAFRNLKLEKLKAFRHHHSKRGLHDE